MPSDTEELEAVSYTKDEAIEELRTIFEDRIDEDPIEELLDIFELGYKAKPWKKMTLKELKEELESHMEHPCKVTSK